MLREGWTSAWPHRVPAVGGQMMRLQGLRGEYDEVFLPLYGAHQAQTRRSRWPRSRRFGSASEPARRRVVQDGVRGGRPRPGRLEVIRRSPTIVLDAAHNPHGAAATAAALEDSFTFDPLIGVVGVMADKDYEGVLAAFEPVMAAVVCTQNSTDRSMPAEELAEVARGIFGDRPGARSRRLEDAIDQAATLAEEGGVFGEAIGSGGVLVTGSVITVGQARHLLRPPRPGPRVTRSTAAVAVRRDARARRRWCSSSTGAGDRSASTDVGAGARSGSGLGLTCCASSRPGCCAVAVGYALGWAVQVVAIGLGFVVTVMFVLGVGVRGALGHGVLARGADRPGEGRAGRARGAVAGRARSGDAAPRQSR